MAAFMLVLQIAMVGQRMLITNIRLFALQSLLLASIANTIAWFNSEWHVYIAVALTVLLKVIVLPRWLERVVEKVGIQKEIQPFINVPMSLVISGGLTLLGYLVAQPFAQGGLNTSSMMPIWWTPPPKEGKLSSKVRGLPPTMGWMARRFCGTGGGVTGAPATAMVMSESRGIGRPRQIGHV